MFPEEKKLFYINVIRVTLSDCKHHDRPAGTFPVKDNHFSRLGDKHSLISRLNFGICKERPNLDC